MDLITGKAKEAFEKCAENVLSKNIGYSACYPEHCCEQDIWEIFYELPLSMKQASIIDWLDSAGIYVSINPKKLTMDDKNKTKIVVFYYYVNFIINSVNTTRHQATQEAIKKAVEIYNKGA